MSDQRASLTYSSYLALDEVLGAQRSIDLDEGVMEWRYRHIQMVRRAIGDEHGSGGSAGATHPATTLPRPAFADLWAVRTEL
jgi:tryptophan 2,3-dioxygenase